MSELEVSTVGRTRLIVLSRPDARNALTMSLLAELQAALDGSGADAEVRCVVLGGAGGHFCSGADLRRNVLDGRLKLERADGIVDAFHAVIRAIVALPKPTVARMEGAAVGFGADLAFACDLRIASTSAYAQEKFVDIGLMPDGGGTFWLPRLVGTALAMRMILLAERVPAAELQRLGVVVDVVAPESLGEATLALARRLEQGPPLAFAAIKRALYASWGSLDQALALERKHQLELLRSADFAEGVAAWSEKRDPRFSGR